MKYDHFFCHQYLKVKSYKEIVGFDLIITCISDFVYLGKEWHMLTFYHSNPACSILLKIGHLGSQYKAEYLCICTWEPSVLCSAHRRSQQKSSLKLMKQICKSSEII